MKKTPWESYPSIWKNKTAFMTYLRGCLRKAWSNNPVKHQFIKTHRHKIKNPNPNGKVKEVWGFTCEMCSNEFQMKECQVDHKTPAGKLNNVEDVQGFVERLLIITDDDLRLVCKNCNNALAMADRYGISYESAIVRKKIIEFGKLTLTEMNKRLKQLGVDQAKTKTEAKRIYEDYIKEL